MGSSGEWFSSSNYNNLWDLCPLSEWNDEFSVHTHRMSFTDWCKFFTDTDVCRLINTSLVSVQKRWHEFVYFGSWTKHAEPLLNRCGGCANHKTTFLQNPQVLQGQGGPHTTCVHAHLYTCITPFQFLLQYLFDITKEVDEVLISLQQKDLKIHRKEGQGENLSIGFGVFKVNHHTLLI